MQPAAARSNGATVAINHARRGAPRSGPSVSRPSSISLPGLNIFPTSRVGPSSTVNRNRGAEREADHPRRGFQFPDLRLKSTRRLDDWRSRARNCKIFFQVVWLECRNPLWSFLPRPCKFCICVQRNRFGVPPLMPLDGAKIVLYHLALDPLAKAVRQSRPRHISRTTGGRCKLIHRQLALGSGGQERLMMKRIMTRKPCLLKPAKPSWIRQT